MKYLALLSGGKDSCFNLLHCAKNGHELVAVASLGPGPGKEELDSYLYQTVGQDAVEFVAQALDVPLFRRIITGSAVELRSEYGSRNSDEPVAGDETEDLFALLSEVKSQQPDIQGVSVGAILSNYQRVRVEHVCRRLDLTPLCYLWNRDQGELLDEMINAGMEAILIKIAGIGLTTNHLGKTLAQMRPTLVKLNSLYGAHICGEGGEYESLTLDCPLFKHRIIPVEVETVIHSDNDFATVAFLRIKKVVLERKKPSDTFDLSIPPLLGDEFSAICDSMLSEALASDSRPYVTAEPPSSEELYNQGVQSEKLGSWVSVTNVQVTTKGPVVVMSLEDEVKECFSILQARLAGYGLSLSNCANINVFLSSMDLFARVNAVYATFFGSSPPARACLGVDLPFPTRVRLDCVAFEESDPTDRRALHVQGLSYWAPANIGPYSQAITAGERIFISGQIGLVPSLLSLPSPQSLAVETALASQHVARITDVLKSTSGFGWVGYTQAAVYWLVDVKDLASVKRAHHHPAKMPAIFVVVKELPKGALFEKQVLLHTGRGKVVDDDGEVSLKSQECLFEQHHLDVPTGAAIHVDISRFETMDDACAIICVKGEFSTTSVTTLTRFLKRSLSIRLFYIPSRAASCHTLCKTLFVGEGHPPMTAIPCRFISTVEVDNWDYALHIIMS